VGEGCGGQNVRGEWCGVWVGGVGCKRWVVSGISKRSVVGVSGVRS
jgi:hypothetical protein